MLKCAAQVANKENSAQGKPEIVLPPVNNNGNKTPTNGNKTASNNSSAVTSTTNNVANITSDTGVVNAVTTANNATNVATTTKITLLQITLIRNKYVILSKLKKQIVFIIKV